MEQPREVRELAQRLEQELADRGLIIAGGWAWQPAMENGKPILFCTKTSGANGSASRTVNGVNRCGCKQP
jgi:hypothetical protein